MKKVEILNSKTNQRYGAKFDDDVKMQAWIDEQVRLDSWGRGERILNEKQAIEAGFDIANAVEIIVRQEADMGGVDQPVNYYKFIPEYVINIIDITAEDAAIKAEKLELDNLKLELIDLKEDIKLATTVAQIKAILVKLLKLIYLQNKGG